MADILANIIQFAGIDPDDSVTLPHRLNVNEVPQKPDIIFVDNGNFSVTGDATEVTVTNEGGEVGSVNVLAINWHTFLRVFGVEGQKSLVVRPYIPAGGAGGAAGMDELVRVSGADDIAGFLAAKLVAGPGVSLDILDPGGVEQILISAAGSLLDQLVKVSADDDAAGFLADKLVAGTNITFTVLDPGGDEDIRLDSALQFQDEGALVATQPALNVVGNGASIVDDPGNNRATLTIPGGLSADGAVVKRSLFKGDTVSTSGAVFVDGMSGGVVTVPINGNYCAEYEGESKNQSGSGVIEIGISVNSVLVAVLDSTRESQGNANDMRPSMTSVDLGALVAADVVRMLIRKSSGAGSVQVERRNLTIVKTQ